jgi:hypothetical protein
VTHDQIEAMTPADRIVAMNSGVVQQAGSPLDLPSAATQPRSATPSPSACRPSDCTCSTRKAASASLDTGLWDEFCVRAFTRADRGAKLRRCSGAR